MNLRRAAHLAIAVGVVAGLVAYSQLYAYVGDESLHLVAAQLVNAGRRPYIDFFYNHTPLFVYLVAGLMRVSGDSWRAAHVFSALSLAGSVGLACLYARDLFD